MGSRGTHGLLKSPLGGLREAMPWVKAPALCLGGAALIWLERVGSSVRALASDLQQLGATRG